MGEIDQVKKRDVFVGFFGTVVDTPSFGQVRGLGGERTLLIVSSKSGRIEERIVCDKDYCDVALAAKLSELNSVVHLGEREFLVPGFIDSHVHASQWPFAGTGVDRPLMADDGFLAKHAFVTEGIFKERSKAEKWYASFLDEMIKQGTTTAVIYATSHRVGCDVLVDLAIERQGPRCYVGKVGMDTFHPEPEETAESLKETEAFICRTLGLQNDLVIPVITPRFIPTCTKELLEGFGGLAHKYGIPTQTHMSETIDELAFSRSLFPGKTDAEVLFEAGILSTSSPSIMAHCTHLVEGEKELLKQTGAAVAHCPLSNFFFAKEALPVKELVRDGVVVALATDIAGGYHPSMLNAMRTAVLASKTLQFKRDKNSIFPPRHETQDALTEDELREKHDLSHFDALYLATAAGAKALGRSDVGTLDQGSFFDALILTAEPPMVHEFVGGTAESRPDLLQKIICLGDDRNIKRVYVKGVQLK
jgi:guanine deaminase